MNGDGEEAVEPLDDASETAQLRAEVEALKTQLAAPPPSRGPGWRGAWRPIVATVLVVLIAVLAPLSVVARWAHWEIGDTDRYVATVTPLASDPDVQNAIADRVTTEIFNYVDVPALTNQIVDALDSRGLPPRVAAGLQALAVPLTTAIQNFVHDKVLAFVQSSAFQDAWIEANRVAHSQLVVALTGQSNGAVEVNGGTVSINLAALIETVKTQLVDQGFTVASKIPTVNASFVLLESADLTKAQTAFHLLDTAATVLPIITLVLFAILVAVSRSKRRGLIAGGLAVAAGMMLLGLIIAIIRPLYLSAIPTDQIPQAAAAAIYDTLMGFIRMNVRGILLIALVVAFAGWVSGSGAAASSLRRGTSSMVVNLRDRRGRGFGTGAFGAALWTYRTGWRIGIAALAVVVLLFMSPITGPDVVWTLVIALVVWLVLELLSGPPVADAASAESTESDEPVAPSPGS